MKIQIKTETQTHDVEIRMPRISVKDGKDIQLSSDVLCMMMQSKYTDWEDLVRTLLVYRFRLKPTIKNFKEFRAKLKATSSLKTSSQIQTTQSHRLKMKAK